MARRSSRRSANCRAFAHASSGWKACWNRGSWRTDSETRKLSATDLPGALPNSMAATLLRHACSLRS
eukprot:8956961-Pyramimonas_sp.AAC.1